MFRDGRPIDRLDATRKVLQRTAPKDRMPWWGRIVAFVGLLLLVAALAFLGVSAIVVAVAAAILWLILRGVVGAYTDVAPPKVPVRERARLRRVGSEPPRLIDDLAYRCDICGRRLTNPQSQRHRVGTDCIKKYGSRARKKPNPEHDRWANEMARARAEQAEQQVVFDRTYATALAGFPEAVAGWDAKFSDGDFARRARARHRILIARTLAGVLVWCGAIGAVVGI